MKKLFSISFALLILLSGMHFTIATHYCGGELAAIKVSVSGELASCGMGTDKDYLLPGMHIENDCCQNQGSIFAVDQNYSPSFTDFNAFAQTVFQVYPIPESITFHSLTSSSNLYTDVSPSGFLPANDVSLPKICVFRI
jgi:hypothetical protein